jgi:CheY-like chemotaxis protein
MSDQAVILLAEDREDDVILIRKAFRRAGLNNPIHLVTDGEEAIAYLNGDRPYTNRDEYPLPHLLLLDLKMPIKDGFDVIRWVRQQPGLQLLPIVVLTSSDQMRDVNEAYQLGANSFLVKPFEFDNLIALSKALYDYWLSINRTPTTFRPPEEAKGEVPFPSTPGNQT